MSSEVLGSNILNRVFNFIGWKISSWQNDEMWYTKQVAGNNDNDDLWKLNNELNERQSARFYFIERQSIRDYIITPKTISKSQTALPYIMESLILAQDERWRRA